MKVTGKLRLFRYFLQKDFPNITFEFEKVNENTVKVKVNGSIEFNFSVNFKRDKKNDTIFNTIYGSLKNQIKESLFTVKRKKKLKK